MTHQENDSRPIEATHGTVGWSPDYKGEPKAMFPSVWTGPTASLAASHERIAMLTWLLAEARWWATFLRDEEMAWGLDPARARLPWEPEKVASTAQEE